jgi:two-component system nitrate/nitrite response regulator NarL
MGSDLATVVVEPRLLVREALKSLMARNSYRIVCDAGAAEEIGTAAASHEIRLVVLGAQQASGGVPQAVAARKLWPDSKVVLLYEHASLADIYMLPTSQIDGCIPVSVSPDTLIRMLDVIVTADVRVLIAPDATSLPLQPAKSEERHQPQNKLDTLRPDDAECRPVLSKREMQILDGLVKGHANKVIARTCDITDATVKVHIRSILRKIRVTNRTQAAVWALRERPPAPRAYGYPN